MGDLVWLIHNSEFGEFVLDGRNSVSDRRARRTCIVYCAAFLGTRTPRISDLTIGSSAVKTIQWIRESGPAKYNTQSLNLTKKYYWQNRFVVEDIGVARLCGQL